MASTKTREMGPSQSHVGVIAFVMDIRRPVLFIDLEVCEPHSRGLSRRTYEGLCAVTEATLAAGWQLKSLQIVGLPAC